MWTSTILQQNSECLSLRASFIFCKVFHHAGRVYSPHPWFLYIIVCQLKCRDIGYRWFFSGIHSDFRRIRNLLTLHRAHITNDTMVYVRAVFFLISKHSELLYPNLPTLPTFTPCSLYCLSCFDSLAPYGYKNKLLKIDDHKNASIMVTLMLEVRLRS